MMRSWLTGLRPDNDDPVGSGRAAYRLPSKLDRAWFSATISAWWGPFGRGGAESVLAYLRETGSAVTRQFSVLDVNEAYEALTKTFSRMGGTEIPDAGVHLRSAIVVLQVGDGDRYFAERAAEIDRKALIDQAETEATMTRLTRIRDTFLRDSAMAGLWWSDGDPGKLLQLPMYEKEFGIVVSLLDGTATGNTETDKTGDLISAFLADLRPEHREHLLDQLTQVFIHYDRPDLADKLRPA